MVQLATDLTHLVTHLLACNSIINLTPNVPYTLSSDEYPFSELGSETFKCEVDFKAPADYVVKATCNVALPSSTYCERDRLVFASLGRPNERYCGQIQNLEVTSEIKSLALELVTFQMGTGKFLCQVEAVPKTLPSCPGPTDLVPNQAVDYSYRNCPGDYNAALLAQCKRTFIAPAGKIVMADCTKNLPGTTGCSEDALVFSGLGHSVDPKRYCGKFSFLRHYSTGNTMDIQLTTSPSSAGGRFNCTITAETNPCSSCAAYTGPTDIEVVSKSNPEVRCPATFVGKYSLLTQAKCTYQRPASDLQVIIPNGTDKINVDVDSNIVHFEYTPNGDNEYNLALIEIVSSLPEPMRYRIAGACKVDFKNLGWLFSNVRAFMFCPY